MHLHDKAFVRGRIILLVRTVRRSRLEVKLPDDEPFRYLDVTVANRPDGVLVLMGECPWKRREYWEQEFAALVGSLRFKD